jgi:hypothetical protein
MKIEEGKETRNEEENMETTHAMETQVEIDCFVPTYL